MYNIVDGRGILIYRVTDTKSPREPNNKTYNNRNRNDACVSSRMDACGVWMGDPSAMDQCKIRANRTSSRNNLY